MSFHESIKKPSWNKVQRIPRVYFILKITSKVYSSYVNSLHHKDTKKFTLYANKFTFYFDFL